MTAASGPPSDLLARLAHGDEAALAEAYARHGRMVYNTCWRQLGDPHAAEDAAQAAFLVLWRRAAKLPPSTDVGGWLHQVAVRAAREVRRGALRRATRELRAAEMRAEHSVERPPDWLAIRGELDEELSRLPERERSVVVLSYLEGLSRSEVAARLDMPEGTVATLQQRALERLRRRYGRRGVLFSAVALAALLAEHAAEAAEPASLLPSLLSAAKIGATGAAATVTSAPASSALALCEEVLKTMFYAKMKYVAVIVLAVAGALSLGGAVWMRLAAEERRPVEAPPPRENRPAVKPAAADNRTDPARAAQAEVVIRTRTQREGRGAHGIDGLYLRLEVLEVLRDERPQKLKAGDLIPFACDFDHRGGALPKGEFTAYLRTEAQRLPEPPGQRYVFIGTPAPGARFPGVKDGVSHVASVPAAGKALVTGTVVDADGRGPIARVKVSVYPADPKKHGPKVQRVVRNPDGTTSTVTGPVFPETLTSELGTFELEVDPCDDLIVMVYGPVKGSASKTGVSAKAGEKIDVGTLKLVWARL